MSIINYYSLAETIDALNQALFYKQTISKPQAEKVINFLCQRQIKLGSQVGVFLPTKNDYTNGIRLFTGEKLNTKLATRNILTVEAARLLVLLNINSKKVQNSLKLANDYLFRSCFSDFCYSGECRHSTVGFIRYFTLGLFKNYEQHLEAFVEWLSQHRDGKGRWKGFPFYYTLLTLSEIKISSAFEEMQYAMLVYEKNLKRSLKNDKYTQRRLDLIPNNVQPKTLVISSYL